MGIILLSLLLYYIHQNNIFAFKENLEMCWASYTHFLALINMEEETPGVLELSY